MLAAPILAMELADLVHPQHGGRPAQPRRARWMSRRCPSNSARRWLWSAARSGEGLEQVTKFLAAQFPRPSACELPILQDVPKCRQWAADVGSQAKYRAPAPPIWTRRLDAVFLHPILDPWSFSSWWSRYSRRIFSRRPMGDGLQELLRSLRRSG